MSAAFFLLEQTKQTHRETHHFWSDSVSFSETDLFILPRITGHKQLTDVYLLGLCQRSDATLITLDTHMTTATIKSPHPELLRILK